MSSIVVDGAHVLNGSAFRVGTVRVEAGRISAVAWYDDERRALRSTADEVVDGHGRWLVPGLISAHTHAYATLLRGTQSALPLELWALYTIAYGSELDDRAIAAAMLLHDAECVRSGITGVVDHFPHVEHAAAAVAAHEESGLRVLFAAFVQDLSDYDLLGIDVPAELRAIAAIGPVNIPAYEAWFCDLVTAVRSGSGRVRVALGPNAPQRCSDAVWAMWRRLRDRHSVAVHAHALETRAQARLAQQRWPRGGMIAALDDAGLLAEGLSLAHAIWTTPDERERLARRGVAVSHNPISNLTLGSGMMPLIDYLDAGVTVGIGTDASNCGGRHDLFETMRTALILPRINEIDFNRWPDATRVMTMATTNGMSILGLGAEPVGIVPGAPGDLVLVRRTLSCNTMFGDTIDGFVAQAGREAIESVMIDGRWVLRDDRILTFDEARMLATVSDVHAQIAERAAAVTPIIDRALPKVALPFAAWQSRVC